MIFIIIKGNSFVNNLVPTSIMVRSKLSVMERIKTLYHSTKFVDVESGGLFYVSAVFFYVPDYVAERFKMIEVISISKGGGTETLTSVGQRFQELSMSMTRIINLGPFLIPTSIHS